ncbi:PstS family phosphate ABC transporter substrate-binding protein [Psychrobacillus sp. NPDC058041]|uniref:PstS family phosphate ABC transporter substrate-binding protein n=1 Tax=Psychrobacillus sp. NPDC058041 TaxID=3346310 RepID=UPI0036D9EC8B
MEKETLIAPVLYAVFVLFGIYFFTIVFLFMVPLTFKTQYLALILTIVVVLYVLYVLNLFRFFKTKKRKIVYTGITATAILVSAISPIQYVYMNWKPSINAAVNIYEYQPFTDSSDAARLEDNSTLQLKKGLPRMDGATALYPLYSAFVQATYPKRDYDPFDSEVMVNTTPDAYYNLIFGNAEMIFVATPSKSQLSFAKQWGVELKITPIGREAFVFFVNQNNEINGLTMEQIKDIYAGKLTNWQEVGGGNDPIRAFHRPMDNGSQSALEKIMEDMPIMERPSKDFVTGIINEVSQYKKYKKYSAYKNYKNAIGYTFRFDSTKMENNNQIKLLEIDGVPPTKETIQSGAYPLVSELSIVTAGTENPNVENLIQWILSPQGQELVEKTGYVPLSRE